jgi:hypothetical protein
MLGVGPALELVSRAIQDPDEGVRRAATAALGLDTERTFARLVEALRSPDAVVREAAAGALARSGRAEAIDPLVDENGRAVVLRARLPNQEGVLRPGLFVSISLVVGQRENAVMIPEQALVPQGSRQLVFKVADGKAVLTPVKLGERRNAMVEIVQGLARGDVVVTAGQIKLRDGVAADHRLAGRIVRRLLRRCLHDIPQYARRITCPTARRSRTGRLGTYALP